MDGILDATLMSVLEMFFVRVLRLSTLHRISGSADVVNETQVGRHAVVDIS